MKIQEIQRVFQPVKHTLIYDHGGNLLISGEVCLTPNCMMNGLIRQKYNQERDVRRSAVPPKSRTILSHSTTHYRSRPKSF